jgi:hypothetical protein
LELIEGAVLPIVFEEENSILCEEIISVPAIPCLEITAETESSDLKEVETVSCGPAL